MAMHYVLVGLAIAIAGCSAILTGIFGSTFGGSNWFLTLICFAVFFMISLLCPILFNAVTRAVLSWRKGMIIVLVPFAGFFLCVDIVTNFGTTALFREAELKSADNQNNKARNWRKEVERLEKDIAGIRATTAWKGVYIGESGTRYVLTDPKAFDKQIAIQKDLVEQEAARVRCGPKCEERQRKLQELEAARANAIEREGLMDQMRSLSIELKEAKVAAAETPTKASAALTHARNFAAGFSGQMDPGERDQFWANYKLSAIGGLSITFASIVASILVGFSSASLSRVPPPQPAQWAPNPYLTDTRTTAPQETAAGQHTLIMRSDTVRQDDSMEALQLALQRLDQKFNLGAA
jgi:hypothetical protein